ncbi:MAG: diguanylate cyclase, partial [Nitrospinota bacterium]
NKSEVQANILIFPRTVVMENKKRKILVVENSPQTLNNIHKILADAGYDLLTASDGMEGLKVVREGSVDLIVSAVLLPGMDGFEFCKKVRESSTTDTIPFIFLTAQGSMEDRQSAFREGADDYITKPFEPGDLIMRVEAGLKRAERYLAEAYTDALTGLNNRRYFDKKLAEMMAHSKRYDESFCLAMLDVDLFKDFNDSFGHVVGDRALKHLATIIMDSIRQSDIHSRFGGEEFTVLLPSTDKTNSITFMDRLRQKISETPMLDEGNEYFFTISIGIAQFPDDSELPDELLKCADKAMYESKSKGRNLTTLYRAR